MTNDFLARADADVAKRNGNGKVVRTDFGGDYEYADAPYPTGDRTEDARRLAYAISGLEKECARVANCSADSHVRNDTLNDAVFRAARFIAEGILTAEHVTEAFIDAARPTGLGDAEIVRTLRSALRGRAGKPALVAVPPPSDEPRVQEVGPEVFGVPPPPPVGGDIFDAEQDFWDRPSLRTIFDAALMRMTPPWGVLAHCAARALFQVRPAVKLPPLIGGPGSLNWFAAVTSASGDGKSNSAAVAEELVPGVPDSAIRNMGSGEGLIAQYRPPGRNPDDRESLLFFCDEVGTMTAMKDRSGSTTMSVLRDAFMGAPPGHSYVKTSGPNPRTLSKHQYRMTLVLSVQPGMAGDLLADYLSGTLQRFQWFPGFDRRCVRALARPGDFVPSLSLPRPAEWQYPRILTVPDEVVEVILTEAEKRSQGLTGAVDGHAILVQEKFAFALAVLDDRTEMTVEDWRLAGIAAEVSRRTRAWVGEKLIDAEDEMLGREGARMGVRSMAADAEKARRTWAQTYRRISKTVLTHLRTEMTNRELTNAIAFRDRPVLPTVLRQMYEEGLIDKAGKKMYAR